MSTNGQNTLWEQGLRTLGIGQPGRFSRYLEGELANSKANGDEVDRWNTGWQGAAGNVAYMGSKVLSGAREARIENYLRDEQEAERSQQAYVNYMGSIVNNEQLPNSLREEAAADMRRVLGQSILSAQPKGQSRQKSDGIMGGIKDFIVNAATQMAGGEMRPQGKINLYEEMGKWSARVPESSQQFDADKKAYMAAVNAAIAKDPFLPLPRIQADPGVQEASARYSKWGSPVPSELATVLGNRPSMAEFYAAPKAKFEAELYGDMANIRPVSDQPPPATTTAPEGPLSLVTPGQVAAQAGEQILTGRRLQPGDIEKLQLGGFAEKREQPFVLGGKNVPVIRVFYPPAAGYYTPAGEEINRNAIDWRKSIAGTGGAGTVKGRTLTPDRKNNLSQDLMEVSRDNLDSTPEGMVWTDPSTGNKYPFAMQETQLPYQTPEGAILYGGAGRASGQVPGAIAQTQAEAHTARANAINLRKETAEFNNSKELYGDQKLAMSNDIRTINSLALNAGLVPITDQSQIQSYVKLLMPWLQRRYEQQALQIQLNYLDDIDRNNGDNNHTVLRSWLRDSYPGWKQQHPSAVLPDSVKGLFLESPAAPPAVVAPPAGTGTGTGKKVKAGDLL